MLDRQLLPAFGSKPLDRIAPRHIGAMVRPVQPDRSGQCQSRARSSHADHQLRYRTRSPRHQPGAVSGAKPETGAHTFPVPGGNRPAPSGAGQADPRQPSRAGGYHPAPAPDRLPQERDPPAALVGSRSRQAGPRRRQDGPQDRSPQHSGPARSRTPAVRRKPLRLSVPERSRPASQPQPRVLVSRPERGGHRGRSPSRSAPYPCQPRSDERRAGFRSSPGCLVIPMCGRRCVTPIWGIARSRQRPREWDNPSPRSYASRMCIRRCVRSATPSASGSCGPARCAAPGAGGASHRPLRSRRRSP